MCSLHLTHPSVHTWSSGQPTVQRPGSSRGLPIGAGIRTHKPWVTSGFKSNALSIRPRLPVYAQCTAQCMQVYALATHQQQVERRESREPIKVCAHHTPATV